MMTNAANLIKLNTLIKGKLWGKFTYVILVIIFELFTKFWGIEKN